MAPCTLSVVIETLRELSLFKKKKDQCAIIQCFVVANSVLLIAKYLSLKAVRML